MKLRRVYLGREEIVKPDRLDKCYGLVDTKMGRTGKKVFPSLILDIKSKKTGNTARRVVMQQAEIEKVGGLYYVAFSNRMIRKNQRVINAFNGVEYEVEPIARVKINGYVVYRIYPIS